MEQRDLYDEFRNLTGEIITKGDPIPKGKYILVVVAVILDENGKFLIQKRSKSKGGKWAITGGHPKHGETSLDGIYTEVEEELGLKIKNPILFKQIKGDDTFCDLYLVKQPIDLNSLKLQEEEVSDVMLTTKEEIEKLYQNNEFKKSHYMMLKDGLEYLEKNNFTFSKNVL